jgi:hypothetical protein
MTREDKILSLIARLDEAYEENMRIAVIEPFGLAEQIAYDALLERMGAMNEYIDFLRKEKSNVKPTRSKNCVSVPTGGIA